VIDEVTKDIQGDIPCSMLFVDDVIPVDETRVGVHGGKLWNSRGSELVEPRPRI
jgi:hypothetical protein